MHKGAACKVMHREKCVQILLQSRRITLLPVKFCTEEESCVQSPDPYDFAPLGWYHVAELARVFRPLTPSVNAKNASENAKPTPITSRYASPT